MFSYSVFSMTKKRELPKPTEGELELLTILWDRGQATVRELFDAVNVRRPVVYTGVLKLLQIMTDKGLVERNESERAHVYRAAVAREETQQRFMREISDRFFAGSAAQLALRALEMETASEEDLNEIRKLLRRKREQ
jgi:BlaI family penicillinase repressor